MKLADLFFENPMLLLMMEHFDLNFVVHDKTVAQVCSESSISREVFVSFANLYNGFHHPEDVQYPTNDILTMITFLRNSHQYYKQEKYPEIRLLIDKLGTQNETPEIKLIGKFFNDYFEEVTEHLDYEDQIAFPYFSNLIENQFLVTDDRTFSADVYLDHHTDIESKLNELKNLLLRHIAIKSDRSLRRQLVISLFELEYDLTIHSTIEESILIPAVKKLENQRTNG